LRFAAMLDESHCPRRLLHIDLRNNVIGFAATEMIEVAARGSGVRVLLEGNLVLDEVINAVTHGAGCVLGVLGSVLLGLRVRGTSFQCRSASIMYCVALCTLYLASTLYHSFHALGPTVVWIFGVFDHCAIYLLIAGTYCPFLSILFPGEAHAVRLLVMLWMSALLGMGTAALYYGVGKQLIQLTLYFAMGWSCVGRIPGIARKLGDRGTKLLVLGGLLYTGGLPFFIRNRRSVGVPDHTIWHIFVLAGSVSHFFCIVWYVVPLDKGEVRSKESGL